jgi:undecaprenyl-diphosphatase
MPDWLATIILGVVEGLTEFLPVSSTGHLLLTEHWIGREESDLFNVVIQCGAVLAVLVVFYRRLLDLLAHWKEAASQNYIIKLVIAFVITGIGGLVLNKLGLRLPEAAAPVAWATLIGGVVILVIEFALRGKTLRDEITWGVAVAAGLAQLVAAVFPGTSRSGITILIALAMGLKRPAATEFSFLLGIPTLLAAGGLKIFSALHHHETVDWGMVLLGSVAAAITAFIAVKWLLKFVQTHTFNVFGWYRIALGILILLLMR